VESDSTPHKLLWIPSGAPDIFERRLWDRLSRFSPAICRTEPQALDVIRRFGTRVAVANGPADTWDPVLLLTSLQAECPSVSFFLRDTRLSISKAVQLARKGAAGVFGNDSDEATIADEVESTLDRYQGHHQKWRENLVGNSEPMEQICSLVQLIGGKRGTVLLTGETGSGKEVLARAIHAAGKRAARPFIAVNCSAIPGTLLESELFGHMRGAFTGATMLRIGRFEQAQEGTLFLDEIGDLDLDLQTKLLRVLQEREIQRLGSSETIRLDVRVIAATHVDLTARIREGTFREDLYYRLCVIPIEVPTLRMRKIDIPHLADHILRKVCATEELPVRALTSSALMVLMQHSWPGNIRELENALERAVALSGDRVLLTDRDFDLPAADIEEDGPTPCDLPDCGLDYERTVSRFEWTLLSKALRKAGGNKKVAADLLGLKRTTLAAKVKVLSTAAGAQVM
jgi:DNA-binding NtrC family response regulator